VNIRKVHESFPIVIGYIVLPRPDVVTNGARDRLAEPGHFVGGYPVGAQQAVDRIGVPGCKELTVGQMSPPSPPVA